MKKIVYKLVIVFTASILSFSSCTEELDRLWNNPNVHTPSPDDVVSGLLTSMQRSRFWVRDYGEWWHQHGHNTFLSIAQISVPTPIDAAWSNLNADFGYGGEIFNFFNRANNTGINRFEWFYRDLRGYGLIRDEIALLSGTDYDNNVIFLKLATVLKDIVALQTVDLFNSIPFFQAFKGAHGIFFPVYDCPTEIYKAVIESYRTIAAELPGIYDRMSPAAQNILRRQDIFFGGDISRWVQFINAQRLRASIRISGVEEAFARTHIAEAIQNLPQEDFVMSPPIPNQVRIGSVSEGGTIHRALGERFLQLGVPDVIMTRMNHGDDAFEEDIDDPRLPFIAMGFTPDGTTDRIEFHGMSGDWERNKHLRFTADTALVNGDTTVVRQIRRNVTPQPPTAPQFHTTPAQTATVMVKSAPWTNYNPVTFLLNETPIQLFTRAEIDLLLAEVEIKGFASTGNTPGEHIYNAVVNSTAFWYMKNQAPNHITTAQWGANPELARAILQPPRPSDAIVSNYASFIRAQLEASTDPMEIIMQQKYIHLNIMDPYELFAELRRTRRPLLEPITNTSSTRVLVNATMTLERYMIPVSERDRNAANYAKVQADDRFDAYIFWVPEHKRGVMPFLPRAIKDPIVPYPGNWRP